MHEILDLKIFNRDEKKESLRFFRVILTVFLYSFNFILLLPYLLLLILEGTSLLWFYFLELLRTLPGWKAIEHQAIAVTALIAEKIMKDKRDYPFLTVMFTVTPLVLGAFIWQLWLLPDFNWWLVGAYYIILFGPRKLDFYFQFFACKHLESHRLQGLYERPYHFLNRYFEWFLGIFYGNIPEIERSAHVGIHHAENNNHSDSLSTLEYDRTNLFHFQKYVLYNSFWHNSGIGPLVYFYRNKKWKLFRRMAFGAGFFYGLVGIFLWLDWRFGLFYLVIPHLTHNALNALLNWTWHLFSDPEEPENYHAGTITLVDDKDDFLYENYHLGHHINPARHWSENYQHFHQNLDLYRDKGALVFRNINLKDLFVMTTRSNRLDELAKFYVDLTNRLTHQEIVALLKKRTRPMRRLANEYL